MAETARTIVLVASNIGQNFGGEAIKAWQYAHHLKAAGHPLLIISHERCRGEVEAALQKIRLPGTEEFLQPRRRDMLETVGVCKNPRIKCWHRPLFSKCRQLDKVGTVRQPHKIVMCGISRWPATDSQSGSPVCDSGSWSFPP